MNTNHKSLVLNRRSFNLTMKLCNQRLISNLNVSHKIDFKPKCFTEAEWFN